MSLAPPTQQVLEFSYSQPMGSSTTVASRDAAHASDKQSFCGNVEGWGPFNPVGDNLTPCFLDGSIAIFAICGILLELCAVWYLLRQDARQPLVRKWVFGAKMVGSSSISTNVASRSQANLISTLIGRSRFSDLHRRRAGSSHTWAESTSCCARRAILVASNNVPISCGHLCGTVDRAST